MIRENRRYLYLSLLPEALIASMLPPEDFGKYLAVGTRKNSRGEAIFFQVDPEFQSPHFRMQDIETRCVVTKDGVAKRTLYLAVYRALEHIPLEALQDLYLTTFDGRTLKLRKKEYNPNVKKKKQYIYQEVVPVKPLVGSNLDPVEFGKYVTNRHNLVSVPKIVFVDLHPDELKQVALDVRGVQNQPLSKPHIDDCLEELKNNPKKPTKTVYRSITGRIPFTLFETGFFLSDFKQFYVYPLPKRSLRSSAWWKSAEESFI